MYLPSAICLISLHPVLLISIDQVKAELVLLSRITSEGLMLSAFFSQGIARRFWGEADGRAVKTGSKVKSLFDTFINQLPSGTQLLVFMHNENGLIDQKTKPTVLYSPEHSEGLVKGEFICNPLKLWQIMKTCEEDICRGF